jgi:hypothetical protein
MNQYPTLLRRLGLVVDLIVNKSAFSATADSPLHVEVKLPPLASGATVKRRPPVFARTRTLLDANRFQPVPRTNSDPGDYRVVDGLMVLAQKQFELVQTDVDGAGLKVMNFARSLALLQQKQPTQFHPVTKRERELGAPSLRNAGLMLVHTNRGAMLASSFRRQRELNTTVAAIHNESANTPSNTPPNTHPKLFAEDLVRGFRIDIWNSKTKRWSSLCQRTATYDLNSGAVVITATEEGTVRLAATKSADDASNQKMIWLHEALVTWNGWSLTAPPPGLTINNADNVSNPEPELPPGMRLQTAFEALPGSLPRLRYGREYWIRARVVDLAGNSLAPRPGDFGPEKPASQARAYLRYDPISAPALALVKPTASTVEAPAEGESMERMAVRTFNETPTQNSIASTQHARRFGVPARTTQQEAEHHGMLDRDGKVDSTFFDMLAAKDHSLVQETIPMAGPLAEPVDTDFAALVDGDPVPYLPDPLAGEIVARIFDLPGFPPDKLIPIPLYSDTVEWPNALPFKIELYENPAEKPRFDKPTRTLFIPIPKATRATLRLSVRPTPKALSLLGIWSWLTPAQRAAAEERAATGQHWMLTPWRHVELVHAVQKPLITPKIEKMDIDRPLLATFAAPNFFATCSIASTDHLDLRATWNEPADDVKKATGSNHQRTDHAFDVKITTDKEYAGRPDYWLEKEDLVRAGGFFRDLVTPKVHEFNDTRYRRIEYWLDATTKFREFMSNDLLTKKVGGKRVPTDEKIKVTGPKERTWIRNSAPPPAPEVLYVVPTFGWVRTADAQSKNSWRRGGGLRVYLNRPWGVSGYGEMLAVVLPQPGFGGDPNHQPDAQPLKNFVTQWGNDPIWSSKFVSGNAPKQTNFPLARFAADPAGKWLPSFAPASEADQPPGPFPTTGLPHPELKIADAGARVAIAPHDVFYDNERQLWFCDIEINFGTAYFPFVRLALARYQPASVTGAHLSNVVLADFMQLVPDRWLGVTATNQPRRHRVTVSGATFDGSSARDEATIGQNKLPDGRIIDQLSVDVAATSVVEVSVERLDPSWGEDFGWKPEPNAQVETGIAASIGAVKSSGTKTASGKTAAAKVPSANTPSAAARTQSEKLLQERKFELLLNQGLLSNVFMAPPLWEGTVTLPEASGPGARYRLVIAEYEEYIVDAGDAYATPPTAKGRRLVFIEHIELE